MSVELKILKLELLELVQQAKIEIEKAKSENDVIKEAIESGCNLGLLQAINRIDLTLKSKELSNSINELIK